MNCFFQIDLIRLLIDKIDELAKEVKRIHMAMLEPIADQSKIILNIYIYTASLRSFILELGQQLDDKTADIKKLAYDISTKLKSLIFLSFEYVFFLMTLFYLEMENMIELQTDAEKCSAQGRIKESQIFVLTRRFRNIMNQYNQDAIVHRDRCKKAISRELEIGSLGISFFFSIKLFMFAVLILAGTRKTDDELEELLESGYPGAYSFSV